MKLYARCNTIRFFQSFRNNLLSSTGGKFPPPLLNEIYHIKRKKNISRIHKTSPISDCGPWLSFNRLCFRDYCSSKRDFKISEHQNKGWKRKNSFLTQLSPFYWQNRKLQQTHLQGIAWECCSLLFLYVENIFFHPGFKFELCKGRGYTMCKLLLPCQEQGSRITWRKPSARQVEHANSTLKVPIFGRT